MSNVHYGINISADGCCDHTKFSGAEEMTDYFTSLLQDVDLIVWGRKTYELMFPYWSDIAREQSGTASENAFASTITAIDKVVFSRTLEQAETNTSIVRGDLEGEFRKLKSTSKKISTGGVSLPSQLVELGLIDEFHFLVHPVIVGDGRRLFTESAPDRNLELQLISQERLPSGAVALHYRKR